MPTLAEAMATLAVIPDGRNATRYVSMLPGLLHFSDWSVDHRYWSELALPMSSVSHWRAAAQEVGAMLDAATADGVMS
jgi:hypothetical protein